MRNASYFFPGYFFLTRVARNGRWGQILERRRWSGRRTVGSQQDGATTCLGPRDRDGDGDDGEDIF